MVAGMLGQFIGLLIIMGVIYWFSSRKKAVRSDDERRAEVLMADTKPDKDTYCQQVALAIGLQERAGDLRKNTVAAVKELNSQQGEAIVKRICDALYDKGRDPGEAAQVVAELVWRVIDEKYPGGADQFEQDI